MNIKTAQFHALLIDRIRQLSTPLEPRPTPIPARLPRLKGIRAVLFDVYGTLFISGSGDISIAGELSNQDALTEALESVGMRGNLQEAGQTGIREFFAVIDAAHAKRRQEGIATPEVDVREEWTTVVRQLQQTGLLRGTITQDAIARLGVEYECRVNPVWPMPDVVETLNALKARSFRLGIVSNAQFHSPLLFPALLGASLPELGVRQDLCVWSYQLLEAKPSVNLFQGVIARLQQHDDISPAEIIYVGNDMLNDIWPATQLGLKTAFFAGDQRSLRLRKDDPRCASLEPDVIITRLSQLPDLLDTV